MSTQSGAQKHTRKTKEYYIIKLTAVITSTRKGNKNTSRNILKIWNISEMFFKIILLKSPLDCKEIQPVHSEGDQPWDFFGRNDAEAETPVLWLEVELTHAKSWLTGKDSDSGRDWGQEEKGTTEDEMAGWHHWLDGSESEWTPGVGDEQGGLVRCDSWSHKESDTTERLSWSELYILMYVIKLTHF